MFIRKLLSLAMLCVLVPGALARADGLIHKLPEDGAYVDYDLAIKAGPVGGERDIKGKLRLSSVGTEVSGAEKNRWIEIKIVIDIDGGERVIISKTLIPEKHLGRGKAAGDNMIRGWLKQPDQEVKAITNLKDRETGPMVSFLAGPALNAMKLDPIEVESAKLGKVKCAGEHVSYEFDQDDAKVEVTFDHRLSDKVPFGLLESKMQFKNSRNGTVNDAGEVIIKLTDIGTTALSELPNSK
jgi:hypothetical protein